MGLFDRPAWAKDSTADSEDEVEEAGDIFRHSDRSYQKIVDDQERQRQERLERHRAKTEKHKVKPERKSSGKHRAKSDSEDDFDHKKRRFNAEDGAALLSEIGLSPFPAGKVRDDDSDEENMVARGKSGLRSPPMPRRAERGSRQPSETARQLQAPIVELDNDGDDDQVQITGATESPPAHVPAEPEDEESDEEFAALARQARERHRRQQLGAAKSATPGAGAAQSPVSSESPPDPVIKILVTSRIPGTKPLFVQRRYTQRLKEIRTVWCQKQGFDPEFTKDVFFTHRMRRLWDVTTCKSLGLGINEDGQVYLKGDEGKEGVDKVHLEAMTNEIIAQVTAEEARKKWANNKEEPEDQVETGAEANKAEKEKQYVRIILKAKGKEDFKLKVKDVSHLIMHSLTWQKTQSVLTRICSPRWSPKLSWPAATTGNSTTCRVYGWSLMAKGSKHPTKSPTPRFLTWT